MEDTESTPMIHSVTASAEWQGGSRQNVAWKYQGEIPKVHVWLNNAESAMIKLLTSETDNTGSCCVTVPRGLIPGEYHVRIVSCSAREVRAESIVLIDHGQPRPNISNVSVASAEWYHASQEEVTWMHQGDVPTVNIWLNATTEAGSTIKLLEHNVNNTGSCCVTVPRGLNPGEYHVVVKSTAAKEVSAESGTILVDQGQPCPTITRVVARQLIWYSASQQEVTWTHKGDIPIVNVWLNAAEGARGSTVKLLEHSIANVGVCRVTVPTGLLPGEYRVQVETASRMNGGGRPSMCADNCVNITIDDEHRERCVLYALGLLGLPQAIALPYPILLKIAAMAASTN